ncbi:hypothetical protein L7F22_052562 [Adiantum nelumboides]|nr:hypothetical protein [Adiantum nelumboides]
MNADDWIELDELARLTIMLTLHKSVYFNVKDTSGAYGVWSALSNLYEKKSAASQGVEFDDSVRAMFLLVTLPDSWDTFRTTVSNSAAPDGLKCVDVKSSLLMEEVNRKNVDWQKC